MLKWTVVTAALLVAWSVVLFAKVVFLGSRVGAVVKCPTGQCQINGGGVQPSDFLIWVIGLVSIVAWRVWSYRARAR
jgi:hypothetical protein